MTIIPILSSNQNLVYQASLELGEATIQQIAQKANIPRSTTYLIIDELIIQGLMATTKQGLKTYAVAETPQKLLSLVESKQRDLEKSKIVIQDLLPELEAVHNNQQDKPMVRFYRGFEGIKSILEQSLESNKMYVICSGGQQVMDTKLEQYMYNVYLPETDKRSIKTREIIAQDEDSERYLKLYKSSNHDIRLSQRPPSPDHLDKLIFDNKVAILAYDDLMGTVIEQQSIANFEKLLFEDLWSEARVC
jgi:sugar-specific transcriptional regulator TrmB